MIRFAFAGITFVAVGMFTYAGGSGLLPPGTYTTIITEADVPPQFPPEAVPVLVGTWDIEFTDGGITLTQKDGATVVTGNYVSNPSRVILHDEAGPLACVDPGTVTGVYGWFFQNNQLKLNVIHDACAGRSVVLTARVWQKQ